MLVNDRLTGSHQGAQGRTALAAEGASDTQIAQQLFVTVKTVEGHLSHACRKLGIRSRRELCDAFPGLG
jgi:DNA-binding CsgD family transcriptional regulator